MPVTIIYTSTQACPPVLELALRLRAQGHELRSLGRLPAPRPVRVASLRLELAGLQQDERTIRWTLSQYAHRLRLPDSAREVDLQDDLVVVCWQIQQVTAKLQPMQGGALPA
jgi:hypothetical protein